MNNPQNNETTQKPQPTRSQVDVLMSDWMGNIRQSDADNFVHRGKGGFRRNRAGSTTDYLLDGENLESLSTLELIRRTRAAAERVINAVSAEPATVIVGGKDSWNAAGNDGSHLIALATDYFDDPALSAKQKADIMIGLASHEAAHSAYTEDDAVQTVIESEKPEFKELKKEIWNLIEDERIEYLLGEDNPGFAENIGAAKEHYFKRMDERMKTEGKNPTEPLPKLLRALSLAVRYPSQMSREDAIENFEELDTIRRTLTPYPLRSQDAIDATDRIMDVIRDMAKKKAQQDKREKQEQEEQQKQQQQQSQSGQSGQPGAPDQNGNNGAAGELFDKNGSPAGGGQGQQQPKPKPEPKVSKKEIDDALKDMLSTAQSANVMKALKQDDKKGDGENASRAINGEYQRRYANEPDAEGEGAAGGDPKEFIFKPKGDQTEYLRAMRRVRQYIPAMSKSLSCKSHERDYVLRGQPYGKLNTNKLVGLRCGNENVFTKSGRITCSSASVVMLIDESGSMSGGKLKAARDAAVLVNEAIARIRNVNFYCYGYTDNLLNVYSENGKTSKWALGQTAAIGGTPTGKAMDMVARRVRRFTSDPCLMLVMTDGFPDSSEEVIRQDKILRKKNFQPIGVGILCNAVQNTFKDNVVMMDISRFAFELGRITRGRLDKMLVRKDENL